MSDIAPTPSPPVRFIARFIARWQGKLNGWAGERLFPDFASDPELARRARLITRFGFLGFIFGMVYAAFYLLIGHYWGAASSPCAASRMASRRS